MAMRGLQLNGREQTWNLPTPIVQQRKTETWQTAIQLHSPLEERIREERTQGGISVLSTQEEEITEERAESGTELGIDEEICC